MQSNIDLVGMPAWTREEQAMAKRIQELVGVQASGLRTDVSPLQEATQRTSSNDSGDITWSVPHGRITFPANVPSVPFHHWGAAIAEATSIAHKGSVAGAKVLAGSVVDLLTDPEHLQTAKATFDHEVEGSTYRGLLPPEQKPPIELNLEEMAKFRDKMKAHYPTESIRFK